jgi:hypothetical protein
VRKHGDKLLGIQSLPFCGRARFSNDLFINIHIKSFVQLVNVYLIKAFSELLSEDEGFFFALNLRHASIDGEIHAGDV